LFDEPIKIDFDVFKTTKTSKTTKPIINYRILYKGHEIDSIDQLSGGEADRVSLAVSCALFKFSDFPFLILDEFASSLDLNNKENAVSSLKAFLGDVESKSIICISHDTVEGMYDYHFRF
jgi:DNA repair exonuclease SbcCD ATPase subunit